MSEADKIAALTQQIQTLKDTLIYAHGYIYSNCNLDDARWILTRIYNAAYPRTERESPLDIDAQTE